MLFLVVAATGFIFYLRHSYSPEKIRAELERAITERTGFAVAIGELEFTLLGNISLRKICIRNADLQGNRCFVAANIASLDLAVLPLIRKRVEIRGIDIADAEIAFFTQKSLTPAGKSQELRSWETAKRIPAAPNTEVVHRFSLQAIQIESGHVFHEVPVLPLPLGKSQFSARIRDGELKKIEAKVEFPDQGSLRLNFQGKSANLIATAKSFIAHSKFEDSDIFDGTVDCSGLTLTYLNSKLKSVTGLFDVGIRQNIATLKTKSAQVAILQPRAIVFGYTGVFSLALPQMTIMQGAGNATGPGFDAVFNNLSYSVKSGVAGNVTANVDLAKAKEGVVGRMNVQGAFTAGSFAGSFTVRDFVYPVSGLNLSSTGFAGQINGDEIRIVKQNFNLDQTPFTGTFNIRRTATQTEFQSAIDKLNYQKLEFGQITAKIILNAERLQVVNGTATLARGRLSFSYSKTTMAGVQSLKLNLAGAKAQDLSPMLGLKARIFGDVNLDATLSATGAIEQQNVTGPVSFRIGRGKIKDSFLQKGILTGPLHKLEEKFSDIEFVSGMADLTLNHGAMSIRKLYFDADEWSISLRAEADKDLQGKAALDFRFRESFIANVANPLHLGIEGRKEGEYYELPFACRGNIASGSCYQQNWQ